MIDRATIEHWKASLRGSSAAGDEIIDTIERQDRRITELEEAVRILTELALAKRT